MEFLESFDAAPSPVPQPDHYSGAIGMQWRWSGPGQLGLEIVQGTAPSRPSVADMRELWRGREARRGVPLVLVVLYDKGGQSVAATCGPTGDNPVVRHDLDPATVERLCLSALRQPDRLSALRFLAVNELEEQSQLPGVRNVGLFATNELADGAPARSDWVEVLRAGQSLSGASNQELLAELGYRVEANNVTTNVLVTNDRQRAVAVVLGDSEDFETPTNRFESVSAVQHGLAAADRLELDWLVLVRGRTLRLYSSKPDVGVGRRGRSATYLEINLDLIGEEQLGLVPLCFGAGALTEDGTVAELLESSSEFVTAVGQRLRDRIYFDAVPGLATILARRHGDFSSDGLAAAYSQTMSVLFRLLFVAYGEDKDLLPYRSNGAYAEHSITKLAKTLTEMRVNGSTFDDHGTDVWDDVQALWTAIDKGREDWSVPAYGGTLFSTDPDINPAGASLASYRLTNAEFGPTLSAVLVDQAPDGLIGPVDFRSLSVREFGTIYEGLLESELSVTPVDLTEKSNGDLVPAGPDDAVLVAAGDVWFHNRSGERKSTGSYFTKPFAVEHLLKIALGPAIESHLADVKALLDSGDEVAAARQFFTFRCADIAMGSGHFLVAAVDHIESAFSRFLAENPIPRVAAELTDLRETAITQLGDIADRYEVDLTQVLRRLIARRCIYGIDLNPVSVELARLGVWIHTFVPGLPLGFLDHNLIQGNSLTGFGTLQEVYDYLGDGTLLSSLVQDKITEAEPALARLALLNDSTATDIEAARDAASRATSLLRPIVRLLDLLALERAAVVDTDVTLLADIEKVAPLHEIPLHQALIKELAVTHVPIAFPEVFSGSNAGFDCILGNPPWDEATVEELGYYTIKSPGLKSLPGPEQQRRIAELDQDDPSHRAGFEQRQKVLARLRQVLLARTTSSKGAALVYPGMGTGDPDHYKAFAWRFWQLLKRNGVLGVVLPRTALAANGSAEWRKTLLATGDFIEVATGTNSAGWMFDDAEHRYTIALLSVRKTEKPDDEVLVRGPYKSLAAFKVGINQEPGRLPAAGILEWTESASFPMIPNDDAVETFLKMRQHPKLGETRGRTISFRLVREFDASLDKITAAKPDRFFHADPESLPPGSLPVIGGKGFNFWTPETGKRFGWAEREVALTELQRRRESGQTKSNSVFFNHDPDWIQDETTLPALNPRVAIRDTARATDSRTVYAALVPPEVCLTNKAPYVLPSTPSPKFEALLLGCFTSVPFDWFTRRIIETNLNFYLFNSLPLPQLDLDGRLEKRVIDNAGRLAAVDNRFRRWGEAVGVPVASAKDEPTKQALIAELSALVSHLYGLDVSDLETIWDTFHTTVNHLPNFDTVIGFFEEWA